MMSIAPMIMMPSPLIDFHIYDKKCNEFEQTIDVQNLRSSANGTIRHTAHPSFAELTLQSSIAGLGAIVAFIYSSGMVSVVITAIPRSKHSLAIDEVVRWISDVLGKTMGARSVTMV